MKHIAQSTGALLVSLSMLAGCGGSSSSPASPSVTTTPAYVISSSELSEMLSEKVMGDPAATVSIIEYSSLTCPHCATFHSSTLLQLKSAYLDTGKVKLIYRDFPVPGAATSTAPAYAAAALARCAGNSRYFDALDLLYRTQSSWAAAASPTSAMKQAAASLGMASGKMDACIASADIQNEINRVAADARTSYGVGATPTFIVNGQKYVGAPSFVEFEAILRTVVK
jgi:protein-disulfide isomerase